MASRLSAYGARVLLIEAGP
ncbi:hypothetical protein, partial [Mesorhizobium sp. M7A.F.Ca.CA.002.07.1.1]